MLYSRCLTLGRDAEKLNQIFQSLLEEVTAQHQSKA